MEVTPLWFLWSPAPQLNDDETVANSPVKGYCDDQKIILERYWDNGMTGYGTPERHHHVVQASEETDLPLQTVKV